MKAGGQLIASDKGIVLAADVFDLEELRRLMRAAVEFPEAVGVKVGFRLGLKSTGCQQW